MGATVRTVGLFLLLSLLFIGFGWIVGTIWFGDWIMGAILFLVLAGVFNVVAYFASAKIVLFTYRARFVTEKEAPQLYRTVRRAAELSGLPMPRVAIVPSQNPNAFATGRNPQNAVVAATEGILRILDERELTGVLAHEMAHIGNRDILVMTIAATIAGAISFMARIFFWNMIFGGGRSRSQGSALTWALAFVGLMLAPIAALLLRLAISRGREYKADRTGAMKLGAPDALADALQKLEDNKHRRPLRFGSPTSANLFIVNPFSGGRFIRMFSTHPPMEERVKRLRALARGQDLY